MSAEEWVSGPWVEDESHKTIGGVRWVALEVTGDCNGGGFPTCDALSCYDVCRYLSDHGGCRSHLRKDGKFVRWYRLGSPALAFFDEPKEEALPEQDPTGRDAHSPGAKLGQRKPPLGLKPRYIHDHERYIEICGAIQRYYDAGKKIPVEWIEEYNELVEKEKCE